MHHFDVRVIGLFLIGWIVVFLVGIALWTPLVPRLGPAIVMRRAVPGAWLTMVALLAINHLPLVGMLLVGPVPRGRDSLARGVRPGRGDLSRGLLGEPSPPTDPR